MKRADVETFAIDGVEFACWIEADGVNEMGIPAVRFVWRSADGRCQLGRNAGNAMCWARVDERVIGTHYRDLKAAMAATVRTLQRQRRAA